METLTSISSIDEIAKTLNSLAGQKVTIFMVNDFGFPRLIHCKVFTVKVKPFAQYSETIELRFVPKGKRNVSGIRLYDSDDLLVYAGHVDLNAEMFVDGNESDMCFSNDYFTRALASTNEVPLIKMINDNE